MLRLVANRHVHTADDGSAAALESRWPSIPLCHNPTPLEKLSRFSEAIGAEIWIKRDDIGSFGVAGAKARKLQLVAAQAKQGGSDALLTIGPPQSNTCRAVAAACAATGLQAHLVVPATRPEKLAGNALLSSLMGATLHWAGPMTMAHYHQTLAEYGMELARQGLQVAVIAPGCSSPLGVVGMALGYLEMYNQARSQQLEAETIWHASATGGVWAGLELGARLTAGPRPRPVLIIDDLYADTARSYEALYAQASEIIGVGLAPRTSGIDFDRSQLALPYGKASADIVDAIELLARTEGILCEPLYTGRALAALVSAARRDELHRPAIFWHTGGMQVLGDPDVIGLLNRSFD